MHRKSIFTYPKETWIQKQDRRMNRKGDGNLISYAEQKILEDIVKNTSRSLQDIYMVLGKVYDDDLALDLNRQAAGYSGMKERAAKCLFDTGLVPPPLGVLERARRWGTLQARTAFNINTGYVAELLAKEEKERKESMEKTVRQAEICGKTSEKLVKEFLVLEEKNIQILQAYREVQEEK